MSCEAYDKGVALRYPFVVFPAPPVGYPFTLAMKIHSWTTRLLLVLLLIATAAGSAFLWWRFMPGDVATGCNPHQRSCSQPLPGGGRVVLDLTPKPLDFSHPIRIAVRLENAGAGDTDEVAVDFAGLDFPTSFDRALLKPVGDGRFEGELEIPTCLFPPLDWQASVLLGKGETRRVAPFLFNTDPSRKPTHQAVTRLAAPPHGGHSILHGANGEFSLKQLSGQVVVLFFGYSLAPASCPQPIAVIDRMLATLSPDERSQLTVVMVSLDPDGDAPARLEPALRAEHGPNYRVATGWDADLIGITGLYGAAFERLPPGPDGKARIAHTANFHLIDRDGRLVDQIGSQAPEQLAAAVRRVLTADSTPKN